MIRSRHLNAPVARQLTCVADGHDPRRESTLPSVRWHRDFSGNKVMHGQDSKLAHTPQAPHTPHSASSIKLPGRHATMPCRATQLLLSLCFYSATLSSLGVSPAGQASAPVHPWSHSLVCTINRISFFAISRALKKLKSQVTFLSHPAYQATCRNEALNTRNLHPQAVPNRQFQRTSPPIGTCNRPNIAFVPPWFDLQTWNIVDTKGSDSSISANK